MLSIDRRVFLTSLGGTGMVSAMSHETRADALEAALNETMRNPTVAEIEAQIPTRNFRRGTGNLFIKRTPGATVSLLPPMPAAPTFLDFLQLRFTESSNHCLQSANKARQLGADEEVVLACLLHDLAQELIRSDHGYWGAQMFEPYLPARTTFAIRYHQALRFYPDSQAGYEYPELYRKVFGVDYVPAPHVAAAYEYARKHRWYGAAREVTVCDLYAFDPNSVVAIDPFREIVARHFRQPKEGLGNDNSPVAHMWRSLVDPDIPL